MSWGSGWRGITGELIKRDELSSDIRQKLRLAPDRLNCEFPKSRKVAHTKDGYCPLGWVLISFHSKEEMRKAQEAEREKRWRKKQDAREYAELQKVWNAMSEEEKDLAILRGKDIAMKFAPQQVNDPTASLWPKVESSEPNHQKALARAFKELWENDPKKWQKKKCSKKQWKKVKRIKEILKDEN